MHKNDIESGDENINKIENHAIKLIIEQFSRGIRKLDFDIISSVFHPRSNSFSLTPRGLCIEPYEAWSQIINSAKTDSTHLFREKYYIEIISIDAVGTVAAAKVEWNFKSTRIIDFYNLIKVDGDWLIVNQVYHTFS